MPTILDTLHTIIPQFIQNEEIGIVDQEARKTAFAIWQEVQKNGYVLKDEYRDKDSRVIFVKFQAWAERYVSDQIQKSDPPSPVTPKLETTPSSPATTTSKQEDVIQEEVKPNKVVVVEQDKTARPSFVGIQSALERNLVDMLRQSEEDKKNTNTTTKKAKRMSIWIIHTPLIATPCVTKGTLTKGLVHSDVEKDPQRLKVTLDRANIIRDYLEAGGILIIAYQGNKRLGTGTNGRTKEQLEIFEELKNKYPKQLLEFPIDEKLLYKEEYPIDKIGATYIVEDRKHQRFEMTNLGVQANAPKDNATWGLWVQQSSDLKADVTERMRTILSFLDQVGMQKAFHEHCQMHQLDEKRYSSLFSNYLNLENMNTNNNNITNKD